MTGHEAPVLNRIRRWLASAEPTPDADLVQRFVAGRDEDAFAALVDRHGPMVLGVARRVIGDHHTAEDVFQAAFLTLARRAAGIRRPGAVAAWLHQTAQRLALTAVRARGRRERVERTPTSATGGDPLEDLSARELLAVLDDELGKLPVRIQQPLVLCCLEGRSSEEAGALLGCSAEAVRGRLERGRRRLRERLARRGLTFAVAAGTPLLVVSAPVVASALRESALAAVFDRVQPSPVIATLVETGLRTAPLRRWAVLAAAVVGFAGVGTVAVFSQRPKDPDPAPRADRPPVVATAEAMTLPAGAVARLAWDPLRVGPAKARLTPDGKKVIALGSGAVVHTFDATSGKLLERRPLGDRRDVPPDCWDYLLSADGSIAAVEDGAGIYQCTVWDLSSGNRLLRLELRNRVRALSPDGRSLAIVEYSESGRDYVLRVHDLKTGKPHDVAVAGKHNWNHLRFAPDGQRILARTQDGEGAWICYDVAGTKELWTIARATVSATSTFTPDSRTVFLSDRGGKVNLCAIDAVTGKSVEGVQLPTDVPSGDPAAVGDRLLFVPLRSGEVSVWDYRAGKELRRLRATAASFLSIRVFPAADGKTVVTDGDGLRRWNLETGELIFGPAADPVHFGTVHGLAFLPSGELLSSSTGGELRTWDVTGSRPVGKASRGVGPELWITRAGLRMVSQDWSKGLLEILDGSGKSLGRVTAYPKSAAGNVYLHYLILADGRTAISYLYGESVGKDRGRVTVTDFVAGKTLSQVEIPVSNEYSCTPTLSQCGRWLAVNGQVFAISSGKSIWTPSPGEGWALHPQEQVKFSPDSRLMCGRVTPQSSTRKEDFDGGEHDVWEVASGARLTRFAGKHIARIAISPDNCTLAYVTGYGVHLLDLVTGKPLAEYEDPAINCANYMTGAVPTLVFSPDGSSVATGHSDGSIMVWKVPQRETVKLTREEQDAAWYDLAGNADPAKARRAVDRLARDAEAAIAIFGEKFKAPAAPADEDVPALIRELDSPAFVVREKATRRLREAGPKIEPPLRDALKTATPEAKQRIDQLLAAFDPTPRLPLTGETLRGVRAIEILERNGTAAAVKQLQTWADQTAELYLSREAAIALDRLRIRDAKIDGPSK